MKIIFKIRQVRCCKNLTLNTISNITGISVTHLSDIERNNKMPSLLNLVLIAKALKVDIDELYEVKW